VTGPYKYRDLELEATLDFDPANGHSAAGFVLRYINEENFYYFLVSDQGSFRFDVVFNKNPIHLIEWTPFPVLSTRPLELRLLARGDGFHFFADDQWIGEMSDATIPEGPAASRGRTTPRGRRSFACWVRRGSRPVEWRRRTIVDAFLPALRRTACSWPGLSTAWGAARTLVELKKSFRQGAARGGRRLRADACLALAEREALQARNRAWPWSRITGSAAGQANTLFQCRRFLEAREFIDSILPRFPQDAALANLAGACEYSLGNWERAQERYRRAVELEPGSPLYLGNLARVLERLGRDGEALAAYLQAARLLFHAEAYDELSFVLSRRRSGLHGHRTGGPRLAALEAKVLFHQEKPDGQAPLIPPDPGGCADPPWPTCTA
jgi:tetratricopeptide (TPR) repeat protein